MSWWFHRKPEFEVEYESYKHGDVEHHLFRLKHGSVGLVEIRGLPTMAEAENAVKTLSQGFRVKAA